MASEPEASGAIVAVKTEVYGDDFELLKKLEEANRELEADNKSLTIITTPVLTRKESVSSITSSASSNSRFSNQAGCDEDVGSGCLWDIWGRLVNDWESAKKNFKSSFLKELVRKGIPHHFRGLAWQLLLNIYDSPTKKLYVEYLKKTSPSEKLIRRDIARTFPDHDFFKEKDGLGQESLFNVMKAYSLHDREVGYCQGSGFIVGLLLMQMPEEEAFAVLVKLMQEFRLRELFKPSMAELGLCMYQLECMIQDLFPELNMHFHAQGLDTSMYASSWFLTLFATTFPQMVACRVMDVFILEGMEIIFRVALAILQTSHEELMSLDMEGMLRFFQKQVPMKFEAEIDKLLQNAYTIKLNTKKLKKLEKEYTALKTKENEEQIELRRLRTENRLLRQRIESLEKESSALADRLIHDQVTRAQEAEETYALKNDLSTTRQKVQNLQKKLDSADELLTDIRQRNDCVIASRILDEDSAQKVIETLQEELISVRLRESETKNFVSQLRTKIKELEDINLSLQKAPSNDVQHLQEELIAVKLREAEANLSLKEMRQKMLDLEAFWERYMEKVSTPPSPKDNKNSKQDIKHLQDELMAVRLKEAQRLGDLKDMKQKLMELETQNQICNNQIRRMDEDNKSLKKKIAENEDNEKTLQNRMKEIQRRFDDIESERKEESMMAKKKKVPTATLR